MKGTFFILIFLSQILLSAKAQTLSILELLQLSNKHDWESVNNFLVNKGWEYYNSKEGDDVSYNTVTWSYEKSAYNDKAQCWFELYTYTGFPNKVTYQFHDQITYNKIKNSLSTNGFKYIDTDIKDERVISKYVNSYFIILLSYIRSERDDYSNTSHTTYLITVIKKMGVYDDENGLKQTFDTDGNLESEYTLKNGRINGLAKAYYSNGRLMVLSNYVNGIKQGLSKEYDENGIQTALYNYVDGKPSGTYKIYEEGKLKLTGTLLNGKKFGQFTVYDSDGNIDEEYIMNGDSLHGPYTSYYYKEGKLVLKITGNYLNDIKNGLWKVLKYKDNKIDLLSSHMYLNGEYNGAFKEVSNDSIIFGTYEHGLLNGRYLIYKSLSSMLTGNLTGDTADAVLTVVGNYHNGQKSGMWKYFYLTSVLRSEGGYLNDRKTGEWKYYYDKILKFQGRDEYEPFSGQLYLIENYENGKKNGDFVQISYLEKVATPCDTASIRSEGPIDTCYSMVYHKSHQFAYYMDDLLNGPYSARDSAGTVTAKGTFLNGEKEGVWLESYLQNEGKPDQYYIFQNGNYKKGKREGLWDEFVEQKYVRTTYNYKNGKLNGTTFNYDSLNRIVDEMQFENGKLKELITYDSLGTSILNKYEILSETKSGLTCRNIKYLTTGKISQVYWIKKNKEDFNYLFFEIYFIFATANLLSDGSNGYTDGEFKVFGTDDKVLVEGFNYKGNKTGKWKFYYYDLNVYIEQEYIYDVGGIESYFILDSGQPFSGKFIQNYENRNPKFEFKISNGLRNGKSKYYSENGNIYKIENYKLGVIK